MSIKTSDHTPAKTKTIRKLLQAVTDFLNECPCRCDRQCYICRHITHGQLLMFLEGEDHSREKEDKP